MAPPPVDLHIVVPVYNEAENFSPFIESLQANVKTPYRLVVVYDFDEDTTVPVVRRFMAKDDRIVLLKNEHRGVLGALKTGLAYPPSGAIIVSMADLSDDHSQIDTMYRMYKEGFGLVAASRYASGGAQKGGPWFKGVLSRTAGTTLKWVAGLPTYDPTNNFKLYSQELINSVEIESTGGFEVALELTVKAHQKGFRIGEIPTVWNNRVAGKSNFKLMKWMPAYMRWYLSAMQTRAKSLVGAN